jgi:hypothetical protein
MSVAAAVREATVERILCRAMADVLLGARLPNPSFNMLVLAAALIRMFEISVEPADKLRHATLVAFVGHNPTLQAILALVEKAEENATRLQNQIETSRDESIESAKRNTEEFLADVTLRK